MRLVNMLCGFVLVDQLPDALPEEATHERTTIGLNRVRKASADEVLGSFSVC